MVTADTVQADPPITGLAAKDEALQNLLDHEPAHLAQSAPESWRSAKYVVTTNRRADGLDEELFGNLRGKKYLLSMLKL